MKDIKTANAKRTIPLHPTLLKIGFQEYYEKVKAQAEPRLWPELKGGARKKYHRNVTEWFNSTSRKNGLKKLYLDPEKSKRKSFNSLRHTFASALKEAGASETVTSELLGHAHGSLAFDRYGKALTPLTRAKEGIDLLDFSVDFVDILGNEGAITSNI